jgi:putative transposase
MPWGLRRFHHSAQSHFITFCCHHRRQLLTTDAGCETFERALERVRRNYQLHVYGYVVMPEHVHLLLSEPGPRHAGGCGEVVEARNFAAIDRRGGALLAKALL